MLDGALPRPGPPQSQPKSEERSSQVGRSNGGGNVPWIWPSKRVVIVSHFGADRIKHRVERHEEGPRAEHRKEPSKELPRGAKYGVHRVSVVAPSNGSRLSCGALKKDSFLNVRAPPASSAC